MILFNPQLSRYGEGVHTFLKGICPKVNVIARLEFELAYYDVAVQLFSYNSMGTLPFIDVNLSGVILCLDVKESHSVFIYIYFFV